ncbi:MAG: hypothetical protein QOH05_3047, partial [Acetobacteraceae bacterium]|nr:hypothetical protein [Acetobacteraceae bacterium]
MALVGVDAAVGKKANELEGSA